jgi:glutathione S-transferase
MATRIYVIPISNPSAAGAAMVRHKRIPHRVVTLMPGFHPLLVRIAGFERHTVPALEADGRKVQGSRQIARFLDQLAPDPPLFPRDREARARVEEAERWGERALQPVPRRLFRYLMLTHSAARTWMGSEVMRLPGAATIAPLFMPVIRRLAAISHADDAGVRAAIERLPELLDHVDDLLADGTIGGAEPNAADFQILASVRVLLEFEELAGLLEGRPCVPRARLLYPDWIGPLPRGLPSAGPPAGSRAEPALS